MNQTTASDNPISHRAKTQVVVDAMALLSFISFWRAAAIVLNDLASSAYYIGGIAELEMTIKRGKSAASVLGQVSVVAPRPFLLSYWRTLSLLWVIVILFAMNHWLKRRAANQGRRNHIHL
jgi:hypothetical protein